MQEKTVDQLIQELIDNQTLHQNEANVHPEFILTNFDEPIPDVSFNPFPERISFDAFRNINEDDVRSDYSALSQALSPGGSLLANGDLLSSTGFNSSMSTGINSSMNDSPRSGAVLGNNPNQAYVGASTPFLTVPTQSSFSRNRSPSICTNHSFSSSLNIDGLEIGDNYGEKSPFPGAEVVQVPSPWIQVINSPSQSILSDISPLENPENLDYSFNHPSDQISFLNIEEYIAKNNFSFDLGLTGLSSTYNIPSEEMGSMSRMESTATIDSSAKDPFEFTLTNENATVNTIFNGNESSLNSLPQQLEEPFPTSVPSGKFWKLVKQNGHTLYQCPFDDCGKTFTRPYNLKSHYRAHTGERPYVCPEAECGSAFSRKHDLKRHSKLHSGEKEYKCKACGKTFSRNDALGRHLRPTDGGKQSLCALKLDLIERESRISNVENTNT